MMKMEVMRKTRNRRSGLDVRNKENKRCSRGKGNSPVQLGSTTKEETASGVRECVPRLLHHTDYACFLWFNTGTFKCFNAKTHINLWKPVGNYKDRPSKWVKSVYTSLPRKSGRWRIPNQIHNLVRYLSKR